MTKLDYDIHRMAADYAANRKIHPEVLGHLIEVGGVGPGSRVLEVGIGTGNYAAAVRSITGAAVSGIDPSEDMLAHAATQDAALDLHHGRAEDLPFPDGSFDLVYSVDVIHHVGDRAALYRGAARALRPGGLLCTVTDSADMIRRREILSGYFPETVEIELARYPRIAQLEAWAAATGLEALGVAEVEEPYEISNAQPFRDRAYSSLHLIPVEAWRAGLERLERDLARGPVRGAARYACVWARRPVA